MYRNFISLDCQTVSRDAEYMPRLYIPIDEICAVLWAPEQSADSDGDYEYTLVTSQRTYSVYKSMPFRQFLVHLFDFQNPERDILQRLPNCASPFRVDFVYRPDWRCSTTLQCTKPKVPTCVAIVTNKIESTMANVGSNSFNVFMRGSAGPLTIEDQLPANKLCRFLFDSDVPLGI